MKNQNDVVEGNKDHTEDKSNGDHPLEAVTNQAQQSTGSDADTSTSAPEAEGPHNTPVITPTRQLGGVFTSQGEGDASNRDDKDVSKKDGDKESENSAPRLAHFSPVPEENLESAANNDRPYSGEIDGDKEAENHAPRPAHFSPVPEGAPELLDFLNIAEHPYENPLCPPSVAALLGVAALGMAIIASNMQ